MCDISTHIVFAQPAHLPDSLQVGPQKKTLGIAVAVFVTALSG